LAFLTQNKAKLKKKFDHNIGICEKRQFFRRKLGKIAENCDHNIDLRGHFFKRIFAPTGKGLAFRKVRA
jgi:hypothetical protein